MSLNDDAFAPVTSAIGFLNAPLSEVTLGLHAWRTELHGSAWVEQLKGGLVDNVSKLEPLTAGVRPRELLVQTQNPEWSALFDCGLNGGDPVSSVGYLAENLQCFGVVVRSVPHTVGTEVPGRSGARQLELFGPIKTEFMNYVRTISLIHDGSRWRFDANGTVQSFEDVSAYTQRLVRKRFTEEMLENYCSALGLRPFSLSFYPGPSTLVTNSSADVPHQSLSLLEAQTRLGINVFP